MGVVVQSYWIKEMMMVKVKDVEREMTMVNNVVALLNNTFFKQEGSFLKAVVLSETTHGHGLFQRTS